MNYDKDGILPSKDQHQGILLTQIDHEGLNNDSVPHNTDKRNHDKDEEQHQIVDLPLQLKTIQDLMQIQLAKNNEQQITLLQFETQVMQLQESINHSSKQQESFDRQLKWVEDIKNGEIEIIKQAAADEIQFLMQTQAKHTKDIERINEQNSEEWNSRYTIVYLELDVKKGIILQLQSEISTHKVVGDLNTEKIANQEAQVVLLKSDLQIRQEDIDTQNDLKYKLLPEVPKVYSIYKNQGLKRQLMMQNSMIKKLKSENIQLLKEQNEIQIESTLMRDFSKSCKLIIVSKENMILRLTQRLKLLETEYSLIKEKYQNLEDTCQGILIQNQSQLRRSPFKKTKDVLQEQFIIRKRSISQNRDYQYHHSTDNYKTSASTKASESIISKKEHIQEHEQE